MPFTSRVLGPLKTTATLPRSTERRLLMAALPLVVLAAAGIAAAQTEPGSHGWAALSQLLFPWLACVGLHLLLCLFRFDGDQVLLPVFSLILQVASAYHLDIRGPGDPGFQPGPFSRAVWLGILVLALSTAGGPWFRRLSRWVEEKLWWRWFGARPYYESTPFHAFLLLVMFLLAVLLVIRGVPTEGGSLIQVMLPLGLRFTPSELIRLVVAFFLADYLGRNSRVLRELRQPVARTWPWNHLRVERWPELMVVLVTVGLYCFFFYAFRDFGPAAVILVLTLATLYVASGRLWTPLALGVGIGAVVAIPTWNGLAFHTLRRRAEMWWDPWNTDFVHGDHLARILWSISSGGWFGLGAGSENLPRLLPLARSDAAFAGIAASFGIWTAIALLGLFAALTWRGFLIAQAAPTDRTRLLAFTLTSLLAFQAVWISGAMVRIFPFTGINLPFVSTGLTSMLVSSLALGALWNLSRTRTSPPDATEATPEILLGITRLSKPITALFVFPALGVLVYGCPWLLGDITLAQTARARAGRREVVQYNNPVLERFRQRFPRGRIFSAEGRLLATSTPDDRELDLLRRESPRLAAAAERSRETGERVYPLGSAAAHLVGWNPRGQYLPGSGSVENSWDSLLRGYRSDQLVSLYRTRHNPLVKPPQPADLQLTVDARLQQFASQRLGEAVRDAGGVGGTAVVYDVDSGDVLAAATAPTFDPNGLTLERMRSYVAENPKTQLLVNKALSTEAIYFPGSAFKILTAGAVLETDTTGSVVCRNGRNAAPVSWRLGGRQWARPVGSISDFSRGGHGTLRWPEDLEQAFASSCNVAFASMAAAVGPGQLREAMQAAGFSRVPSESQMAEHLPYSGFGQIDIKVAPVELLRLAGAVAAARDDGSETEAREPHWVQAILTRGGRQEPNGLRGAPQPDKPLRPFSHDTLTELRRLMLAVVTHPRGTAHAAFYRSGSARLDGISVGGKTGTAEFDKIEERRGRSRKIRGRHAWFVGFARSDHELQPRTIAFAILVEDVRAGRTGGNVCAPVARDLIAEVLPQPYRTPATRANPLQRLLEREVRPRLGPLGSMLDWLRRRFGRE